MKKQFGIHLRAFRLGFRELEPFGYVRIMPNGTNWTVDVCPFNVMPRSSPGLHVCWWEGENAKEIAAVTKAALSKAIQGQKGLVTLTLDDNGNVVPDKEPV